MNVLIIVPYDQIYPPMNGGMQRCFHIMHQLATHVRLTAIIHQDKKSFLECVTDYPAFAKAAIYSTKEPLKKDVLDLLPSKFEKALRSRWYQREWTTPADGNLLQYYPVLSSLLKQEKFDGIILENLATLNAVNIIRRFDTKVKIIYDAHNVDTNLAKAAFKRQEISSSQLQTYREAEQNLYQKVDAIFTCSEDDKASFLEMNENKLLAEVIPNGVRIPERKFDAGTRQDQPEYILFCGSLWSIPNAEGLYWFCKKIWPIIIEQLPALKLLVVGSGELPEKYAEIMSMKSIDFTGPVADVKSFYNKAAIAIVPLLTGSGTRLKVLEAMGLGVPVVSTSIGAEGIACQHGDNILIADTENEFAERIIFLFKNKDQRLKIGDNALKFVEENYDWNVVGANLAGFLNSFS